MGFIPIEDRIDQSDQLCSVQQEVPVVSNPRPSVRPVRDEIGSEPEVMRALPRARFRGLGLKQLLLPSGAAETLEEFEKGLRAAGLVRVSEVICQTTDGPLHFRVKRRNVAIDGHYKPPVVGRNKD